MIGFLLALLLLTSPAHAVSSPTEMLTDPALETRAQTIGQQLRCMVCQNESVEESEADLARDFRRVIREHVAAGESDTQVIGWMVQRYGDFIRLRPPFTPLTALLWAAPVLALGGGVGAVFVARRRRATPPAPLTEAERRQLDKMLSQ